MEVDTKIPLLTWKLFATETSWERENPFQLLEFHCTYQLHSKAGPMPSGSCPKQNGIHVHIFLWNSSTICKPSCHFSKRMLIRNHNAYLTSFKNEEKNYLYIYNLKNSTDSFDILIEFQNTRIWELVFRWTSYYMKYSNILE